MTAYHIDYSVTGPGSGSIVDPFKQAASVPALSPGDQVLFKSGVIHEAAFTVPASGATGNPIVIGTYGGTAPGVVRAQNGATAPVLVSGRTWVTVQDLDLRVLSGSPEAVVHVINCANVTISRCICDGGGNYGIKVDHTGASALQEVRILDNIIGGSKINAGIAVITSAMDGGIFENVVVARNSVNGAGLGSTNPNAGSAMAIRFINRAYMTLLSAGVDVDARFSKGVQIIDNVITDAPTYGISVVGVKRSATTIANVISGNRLVRIGNGSTDTHCIWLGTCRDVLVERNEVTDGVPWAGQSIGTAIGIFCDQAGNSFGSRGITIRHNRIRRCGVGATTNTEVGGGGVATFLSSDILIAENRIDGCNNGVVVLGTYDATPPPTNIRVSGNLISWVSGAGVYVAKKSDSVSVVRNVIRRAARGIYAETSGGAAITNFTEMRNDVRGCALSYAGGDEPTTLPGTVTVRTPSANNLINYSRARPHRMASPMVV